MGLGEGEGEAIPFIRAASQRSAKRGIQQHAAESLTNLDIRQPPTKRDPNISRRSGMPQDRWNGL